MTMPLFLQISQYTGFIFTEFTNILLLWLIVTKSSSRFGSYKYIMMSYAVFSIFYAVVEILTQPVMHLGGTCMFIYADSFLKFEKTIAVQLVGLYCATFGLCVLLLATHFVYRYCVICRPHDLRRFEGLNLIRVYLIPIFFSVLWFLIVTINMAPTDFKSEYMRESILKAYDDDTFKVGYIALLYHYSDSSGKLIICWIDFISAFTVCAIMQICIIIIFICGWKTFWTMQSVKKSMSPKTKELNNQLFRTLILQSLIPLCTMFAPVGLLILFPIFSIGVGKLANAPSFYAGFYPAIDAIIVIFMIRDFRDTILCHKTVIQPIISVKPTAQFTVSAADN